jgi:hypothetical protein
MRMSAISISGGVMDLKLCQTNPPPHPPPTFILLTESFPIFYIPHLHPISILRHSPTEVIFTRGGKRGVGELCQSCTEWWGLGPKVALCHIWALLWLMNYIYCKKGDGELVDTYRNSFPQLGCFTLYSIVHSLIIYDLYGLSHVPTHFFYVHLSLSP